MITKTFSGLPPHMDSVFRYINGMLYIFKDNSFYEYNEFTNLLIRTGENDLSLFGIKCSKFPSTYSEIMKALKNAVAQSDKLIT
jgi:hypothetical protein